MVSNNNKVGWLKTFGETTAKEVISALFFICLLPILYISMNFGKFLYLNNMYSRSISYIQNGQTWYTSNEVNNLPLGIFGGIAFFIVVGILWKIICELLIIIFRAIETYTKKNQ